MDRETRLKKKRECAKRFYDANTQLILERNNAWRENNREKDKAGHKRYRVQNKDMIRFRAKKHYQKNKEKILLKNKIYRLKQNQETKNAYGRKYNVSEKGRLNKILNRIMRRTLNKKYPLTKEKLAKIMEKTNEKCYYCPNPLNENNITIDHLKPVSKGGTNHLNNLVPACRSCNFSKQDMNSGEFKEKVLA